MIQRRSSDHSINIYKLIVTWKNRLLWQWKLCKNEPFWFCFLFLPSFIVIGWFFFLPYSLPSFLPPMSNIHNNNNFHLRNCHHFRFTHQLKKWIHSFLSIQPSSWLFGPLRVFSPCDGELSVFVIPWNCATINDKRWTMIIIMHINKFIINFRTMPRLWKIVHIRSTTWFTFIGRMIHWRNLI